MAAKKFSEASLDPVASNRLTHPCADRNAESVLSPVVCFGDDNKVGGVNLSPSS